MPRPKNPVPNYKKHPTKDEARCWAGGRWVSLGKYGSESSRREYEKVCAVVRKAAVAGIVVPPRPKKGATVDEVVVAFVGYAAGHYRLADGRASSELRHYRDAVAVMLEMYGESPAAEFGPLALQAVRQAMIEKEWCRNQINKHVGRLRRVFKWAASQELVPPELPLGLACVQGLQRGRTTAKESEPVKPVAAAVVAALLPTLLPTLRAMVELQRVTGMRPGEVRLVRPCDIERGDGEGDGGDGMWVYRPPVHKMAYLGKGRPIPLGPRARAILAPWIAGRDPESRCFTPANCKEERYAALRAKRATKVQPSQVTRRKPVEVLKKVAGFEFTDHGYANMLYRAADRAGVERFHPNQIRHLFATEVRKKYGLEAAQVLLGHAKADVTQVYAARDLELALRVAGEVG